jgi:hypothetical protein
VGVAPLFFRPEEIRRVEAGSPLGVDETLPSRRSGGGREHNLLVLPLSVTTRLTGGRLSS